MTGTPLKLVGHLLMEQQTLPPMPWPYGYVIASTGVFVWAKRQGLEALVPVARVSIGGLSPVEPFVHLAYPLVDSGLVSEILRMCREARTPSGEPLEILFYLAYDNQHGWVLTLPPQEQQATRVTPVLGALDQTRCDVKTLIEIHSHHQMPAFFSEMDTADEQGFRLYGVVGHLDRTPEIRMRVGIYGQFWEIAASTVLSLPSWIRDGFVQDHLPRGKETAHGA